MISDLKRCERCMKEMGQTNVCPLCGHVNGRRIPVSSYLSPGTLLNNRYVLGMLLRANGESAVYIAYDTNIELVIEIKEFFPDAIAERLKQDEVQIQPESQEQFDLIKSDFISLNNTLSKLRTQANIVQVYETFEQNNTAYAVMEHIEGINLREYLSDHSGELPWEQAAELFLPIMKTLGELHNMGIFHHGLSPETIYINNKNQIKINDFSIRSLRTVNDGINAELFKGYAAPEQYSDSNSIGSWSDVYSFAAVAYKTLTGTMPTDSKSRSGNDNLIPADVLNPAVPKNVSIAIMAALTMSYKIRTQTMPDFLADIVAPLRSSFTANYAVAKEQTELEQERSDSSKKHMLIAIITTAVILVIISVWVLGWLFGGNDDPTTSSTSDNSTSQSSSGSAGASSTSNPSSTASTGGVSPEVTHLMFSFIGKDIEEVLADTRYTSILTISQTENFNDDYPIGQICAQSIAADRPITPGQEVVVTVSKGPRYQTVPDFEGKTVPEYTNELEALGIDFWMIKSVQDPSKENGTIIKTAISPGKKVDMNGETMLEVYVVAN